MAVNLTPNYGLKKPDGDEFIDISQLNDNADIIDAQLKSVNDGLAAAGSSNLQLGETSSTAYRGDRGKEAYLHSGTYGNPHNTTAANVGAIPTSEKGVANGVATLDSTGKVPSSMLGETSGGFSYKGRFTITLPATQGFVGFTASGVKSLSNEVSACGIIISISPTNPSVDNFNIIRAAKPRLYSLPAGDNPYIYINCDGDSLTALSCYVSVWST